MNSLQRRLKALEDREPTTIMGLFVNDKTGEEEILPIAEVGESFADWSLKRVVSGSDLRDLDRYILSFRNYLGTVEGVS